VADTVRAVAIPLVEAGLADAELGTDGGAHELRPRKATAAAVSVYMQSQHEVSLWPRAPGTDRAPTGDIYDADRVRLLSSLREYLDAIVAGRIELTLRKGLSAGRCRFWLSGARTLVGADCFPVGDQAPVGELGVFGELVFLSGALLGAAGETSG
jgi:hypothetical protein